MPRLPPSSPDPRSSSIVKMVAVWVKVVARLGLAVEALLFRLISSSTTRIYYKVTLTVRQKINMKSSLKSKTARYTRTKEPMCHDFRIGKRVTFSIKAVQTALAPPIIPTAPVAVLRIRGLAVHLVRAKAL